MRLFILFVILATSCQVRAVTEEYLIVRTTLGYIRGIKSASRNGRTYTSFKGVQYGIANKRFQAAEEVEAWNGVRNTLGFGSKCAQQNTRTGVTIVEENCLYLNVYVPEGGKSQKPVIFYIHGGGWTLGSSNVVGEKYIMDEDVILVTINYRLGALGFLALQNSRIPSNVGFLDQLLALKWVNTNIGRFGGDANKITLMGNSAGAGSISNFLVSTQTEGLFHRAILHSGSTFNFWTWRPLDEAEANSFELGELLGCNIDNSDTLLDCLLEKSVEEILQAQNSMLKFYMDPVIPFIPVFDEGNPTAFLQGSPVELIRTGKFHRVPTILTLCADDGLFSHGASIVRSEKHMLALDEFWSKNAGIQIGLDEDGLLMSLNDAQKHELMTRLRHHYFGNEKLRANDDWTRERLTEFYTDRFYLYGIRETALAMSKYTSVYTGIFTDVGADSVTRMFGYNHTLGVSHVDDLQFFFNEFGFGPFLLSKELTRYSEEMVKIWTNFASSGVPSGHVLNEYFEWPEVSPEERKSRNLNWADLGNLPDIIVNPHAERLKIWETIYKTFGKQTLRDEL